MRVACECSPMFHENTFRAAVTHPCGERTPRLSQSLFLGLMVCGILLLLQGIVPGEDLAKLEENFVRLVEQGRKSVVTVTSKYHEVPPLDGEAPAETQEPPMTVIETNFSGVVVRPGGYIMTCGNAIEGADEIVVTLPDDSRYTAQILGSDTTTNLALLKIDLADPASVHPVAFADPATIRQGMWVLAIGNPFGLTHSVSFGVLSGLDRVVTSPELTYTGMLQTTAPVNPGDAGGLLINLKGEMVGIILSTFQRAPSLHNLERAIEYLGKHVDFGQIFRDIMGDCPEELFSGNVEDFVRRLLHAARRSLGHEGHKTDRSRDLRAMEGDLPRGAGVLGAEGINFAVPVDTVQFVLDRLAKEGKVRRGWLGVGVEPIDAAMRAQLGIPDGVGILISSVLDGSPAKEAGLEVWDVVLAGNNVQIRRPSDLEKLVTRLPDGSEVKLEIIRQARRAEVTVKLRWRED